MSFWAPPIPCAGMAACCAIFLCGGSRDELRQGLGWPCRPLACQLTRGTAVSASEGDQLKSPIGAGLCRHCSTARVRSWLWHHGEKGPCRCVFAGLRPTGTGGGSHQHSYLTVPITTLISHVHAGRELF